MGKLIKWFIVTISVGLAPIGIRLLMYLFLIDDISFRPLTVSDVLIFGFVLNLSIFNEREGHFNLNPVLGSFSSKLSVFLIILYAVTYSCELFNEIYMVFKQELLLKCGLILGIFSFVTCCIYIFLSNPRIIHVDENIDI